MKINLYITKDKHQHTHTHQRLTNQDKTGWGIFLGWKFNIKKTHPQYKNEAVFLYLMVEMWKE